MSSNLIDTARTVFELTKKGATIELREELMKLREQALELQEENHQLREELALLKRSIQLDIEVEFDGSVYWSIDGESGRDGPFCQRCFDLDKIPVRMQSRHYVYEGKANYSWHCLACKTAVADLTK